jgi:hypothetical protein
VAVQNSFNRALANRLTLLLGRLRLGPGQQLPADTRTILRKLHILDDDGQAFRYSKKKKTSQDGAPVFERVRPGEQRFDIVAVAEAMRDAGTMVLHGVSGVLDVYSDYQADMRHDAGL